MRECNSVERSTLLPFLQCSIAGVQSVCGRANIFPNVILGIDDHLRVDGRRRSHADMDRHHHAHL